jgi:nitrite reductase/ring-hydroxylating ferredoxin subunit
MGEVICQLHELADRQCREFELQLEGAEPIPAFVLRLGEEVVAYRNHCPHTGAPLNWNPDEFLSYDRAHIQCAIHGALFRLEDGYCLHGPCNGKSLHAVALRVEAGVISTK